ncbi:hypothetical protein BKA62DRAFT_185297 [Auriculariales sp. MPI-PUGE-AT-0066]|nr:hypothetical protein BKA62DRAFT_185297 [Auriculariales sp. MPI-PUGE-AT-0066]
MRVFSIGVVVVSAVFVAALPSVDVLEREPCFELGRRENCPILQPCVYKREETPEFIKRNIELCRSGSEVERRAFEAGADLAAREPACPSPTCVPI